MTDQSNYISYLPMLIKTVELSTGPIIELGMGFSTVVLHMLCKQSKRHIYSYENDTKWWKQNIQYLSDYHDIIALDNWDIITPRPCGVLLVDHRPAIRRRIDALRFKDFAEYILLHDSEPEIDRFYRYSGIYKHFKYRYDYRKCTPNTTVVSNLSDLSEFY